MQHVAQPSNPFMNLEMSTSNMIYAPVLLPLIIWWLAEPAVACGVTTHIAIGHRAASNYDSPLDELTSTAQLLRKHQSAFQAGNPYPDSFYSSECSFGKLSDVSEDTHWVPFLNATINYIRGKYTKPYNEDAQRLVAFTLGIASHQMADVTWHSLGIQQGFLSAMGFSNFHGSFAAAHRTGDIGADFVNRFELDLDYVPAIGDWYVPYEDLFQVYKRFYGHERVSRSDIIQCSSLLFLARLGEAIQSPVFYEHYASKSAFLDDQLNDYFLGGMNDMSAWTQIAWNKVLLMISNGTDLCHTPASSRSILDLSCHKASATGLKLRTSETNEKKGSIGRSKWTSLDARHMNIRRDSKGVTFSQSKRFERLRAETSKPANRTSDGFEVPAAAYSSSQEYANLGWSLAAADLNRDGGDDLLIGAPNYSPLQNSHQSGSVFVVLSADGLPPLLDLSLETSADMRMRPPANVLNARFGHSMVVLDINLDGFEDIVISAPSYGLANLRYEGRVFIYLGGKNATYEEASIEIKCELFQYCNLGWALAKGDLNMDGSDDLIISSPFASTCADQCGYLGALLAKRRSQWHSLLDAADLDFVLLGNMAYEWFGHSAVVRHGLLAVGAPESRLCAMEHCEMAEGDRQAVGRVYLYKYPSKEPFHVFAGSSAFEQFGYSFDVSANSDGKDIIAVASVTKQVQLNKAEQPVQQEAKFSAVMKNAGEVNIFKLCDDFSLVANLKSDRSFASFGSRVKFKASVGERSSDLFVSAVKRSPSSILEVPEGQVYRFKGGSDLKGNVTDECSKLWNVRPCPDEKATVYSNLESKSKFGFEIAFLSARNSREPEIMAISSIFSGHKALKLAGRVNIYNLSQSRSDA